MIMKKIAIVGTHGTGKSRICEKVESILYKNVREKELTFFNGNENHSWTRDRFLKELNFEYISEQFREVVKDISNFKKQTKEITLATYNKQSYLENLYVIQGKNILCDRSVLDTFVYSHYLVEKQYCLTYDEDLFLSSFTLAWEYAKSTYSKIYLITPSDREIENDGFRLTDKQQQLEIHKLFLEYFKDFNNVEIIDQEEANKEEFIIRVVSEFSI